MSFSDRSMGPMLFFASFACNIFIHYRHRVAMSLSRTGVASTATNLIAIKTKKVVDKITFGVKDGEYRGECAMNPPRVRLDYYNWLRDHTRKNKEVIDHLNNENNYCNEHMKPLAGLQDELYNDMLSHLKETDEDLPYKHGDYEYYSRTVQGLSYKIHCRKTIGPGSIEEILLDENALAVGKEYTVVGSLTPSPDHRYLAYTVDHSGYETYAVYVKDTRTGDILEDIIEGTDGTVEWDRDASRLYYMTMDEEHRPHKLYLHVMGTTQSTDACLAYEADRLFSMGLDKTATDRFIVLTLESKETSEQHVIDLTVGVRSRQLQCVSPRQFGVRYELEHFVSDRGDDFLIVTNKDGAKNNKIAVTSIDEIGDSSKWSDLKPYDSSIQIDSLLPFKNYLAIFGRQEGLESVWIAAKNALTTWKSVSFDEEVYSVWCGDNYEYDQTKLRIMYSSLVTPQTTFDYDMNTNLNEAKKVKEVPHYDPNLYHTQRIYATARDGKKVPMSLVYKKSSNWEINNAYPVKPMPCLLYGYGSYGYSIDPKFDYKLTTLLNRGVVYVIAHVRGGGELGKSWYEDEGKYTTKLNTFYDFADCAKSLIDSGVTSPENLAIVGRSAGGLLVGATINMYPNLFKAAVADVPFVDALNTMSDPSIPLTVGEWEEWGNPNEEKYYDYMEKYSPYDNVVAQDYPALLVTAGLNDPRVAYWEPAKWVAKLREFKTDTNPLLLKTDMGSGHFSASDRYKYLKERAFEYAFILNQITPQK